MNNINITPYIIVLITGFFLGTVLNCNKDKNNIDSVETKIKVVERIKTVEIEKPIVEYKYKEKKVVVHDTIKEQYKYVFKQKEKFGDIEISGWGDITNIKVNTIHKDSIIEKTITKHLKGFYVNGEYNRSLIKDNPLEGFKIGLDYVNKNIIVGTNIGIFNSTPIFGFRVGFKL